MNWGGETGRNWGGEGRGIGEEGSERNSVKEREIEGGRERGGGIGEVKGEELGRREVRGIV